MLNNQNRLIWIDLEMTGLDTEHDSVLEIATIVTDSELNELATGPVFAIGHKLAVLEDMDAWNTRHHRESGLWDRVLDESVSMQEAQRQTIEFLNRWLKPGLSPMCGNSICQDRRFLHRLMPELEQYFHYRNLDVSTLKELVRLWKPDIAAGLNKTSRHQALSDIRESIEELQYYRQFMGLLGEKNSE